MSRSFTVHHYKSPRMFPRGVQYKEFKWLIPTVTTFGLAMYLEDLSGILIGGYTLFLTVQLSKFDRFRLPLLCINILALVIAATIHQFVFTYMWIAFVMCAIVQFKLLF